MTIGHFLKLDNKTATLWEIKSFLGSTFVFEVLMSEGLHLYHANTVMPQMLLWPGGTWWDKVVDKTEEKGQQALLFLLSIPCEVRHREEHSLIMLRAVTFLLQLQTRDYSLCHKMTCILSSLYI